MKQSAYRLCIPPLERAPFPSTFASQSESLHHVEHLLMGDINASCAKDCIAHVGVEKAVIPGQCRDGFSFNCPISCGIQSTPLLLRLSAPGIISRSLASF